MVGVTASVIICGFGWGHPQAIFLAGLIDAGNPLGYIFLVEIHGVALTFLGETVITSLKYLDWRGLVGTLRRLPLWKFLGV